MSVSLAAILRAAPSDTANVILTYRVNDTQYGLGGPVTGKVVPGSVDLTRQQICRLLDDCKGYKAVAIVSAGHFVCWEETKLLVVSLRRAVGLPLVDPVRGALREADVGDLLAALNHPGKSKVHLRANTPSKLANWIFRRGQRDTQRRNTFRVPLPLPPFVHPASFFPDLPHSKLFDVLRENLMACVANYRCASTSMFPKQTLQVLSSEQPALPFLLASLASGLTAPMRTGAVVGGVPTLVWRRLLDHYVTAQFVHFCRNEDQLQSVMDNILVRACVTATPLSQCRLDIISENVDETDSEEIVMPSQSMLSRRAVACSLMASSDSGDWSSHTSPSLLSSGSHFGRSPSMDSQMWATPSGAVAAPFPLAPFSFCVHRRQKWRTFSSRHLALQFAAVNGGAHVQLLVGATPGSVAVLAREDMLDECVEHFAAEGTRLVSLVEQGRAVRLRIELNRIYSSEEAQIIATELRSTRWAHFPTSQTALFSFDGTQPGTLFIDHASMTLCAIRRTREAFQRIGRQDRPELARGTYRAVVPRSEGNISVADQLFHVPRSTAGRRVYLAQDGADESSFIRVLPGTRGNTRIMRAISSDQVCGVTVETRAVFRSFYYQPVSVPEKVLVASGAPRMIYCSPSTTAFQHAGLVHNGTVVFTISHAGIWASAEWMAFAERMWIAHPMRLRGWFGMAVAAINAALAETVKAHRRKVVTAKTKSSGPSTATERPTKRTSIYDLPGVCLAETTNALRMPYAIMPVVVNTVQRQQMGLTPVEAEGLILLRYVPASEANSGYTPWMKVGRALYEVSSGPAMAAGFRVWSRVNGPDSYNDADHGVEGKRWPGFRPGYNRSTCESSGLHALRKRAIGVDYAPLEVADALEWFAMQHLALFGEPFPRGNEGRSNAGGSGEADDEERGIVS